MPALRLEGTMWYWLQATAGLTSPVGRDMYQVTGGDWRSLAWAFRRGPKGESNRHIEVEVD